MIPQNPFKQWYESLPAKDQSVKRDRIIYECAISKKTFYNYLNADTVIPKLVKKCIAGIARRPIKNLFPCTKKRITKP